MMRSRQQRPNNPGRLQPLESEPSVQNSTKSTVRKICCKNRWLSFILLLGLGLSYYSTSSSGVLKDAGRPNDKTKSVDISTKTGNANQNPSTKNAVATADPCEGVDGIYHIQSGDVGGAAATIFFQFVIAQLIYADAHNLKPWVYFNNISHHVYDQEIHNATQAQPTLEFTMMKGMEIEHFKDIRLRRAAYPGKPYMAQDLHPHLFSMTGDGVWEHYFEPVSDFVPSSSLSLSSSCATKPLITMDIWLITPGLHIYAPWTPRMWRYDVLPDYMQQRHLTLREWVTPQRIHAHTVTQKYIRIKQPLWDMADKMLLAGATTTATGTARHCIGLHIRWSDKGGGRRLIGVDEFLPFVEQFLHHGGNCVMVATDSGKVFQHIGLHWPDHVRAVLTSQGDHVLRSNDETPVFEMTTTTTATKKQQLVSHHRTNTEVLVDILALSKCDFLLHGHSAVSDAAMYLNDNLIYQSVNLEDPDDFSPEEFATLVDDVLVRRVGVNHTKYFPKPWWKQYNDNNLQYSATSFNNGDAITSSSSSGGVCDGYQGILHIAVGGGDDFSFGMTFFHFILNQLLYADMNNLKPWIHLSKTTSQSVYDESVHGSADDENEQVVSFEMLTGVPIHQLLSSDTSTPDPYPGAPDFSHPDISKSKVSVSGNGVWNNYFVPVSDFDPNNPESLTSCQNKPLVSLDKDSVSMGLHKLAPWSIKSFRYSGVTSMESYRQMRTKAHELVKKYYKPQPFIWKRVQQVNPIMNTKHDSMGGEEERQCLAIHIRQGDVEAYGKRKLRRIKDFKPFIEAFFRATDDSKASKSFVYLATDSWRVIDSIQDHWPADMTSRIRSQGNHVVRSVRWVPAHLLEPENHHRANAEALVDILAMSQCHYMVHGSSTVSEAAIYWNLALHDRSVNLDDPNHVSLEAFEALIRSNG